MGIWSGRPGSNRRRPAWEAGILPLNYSRSVIAVTAKIVTLVRSLSERALCIEHAVSNWYWNTGLGLNWCLSLE